MSDPLFSEASLGRLGHLSSPPPLERDEETVFPVKTGSSTGKLVLDCGVPNLKSICALALFWFLSIGPSTAISENTLTLHKNRPETDLKKIGFPWRRKWDRRFPFYCPSLPAPFLPNGGIPSPSGALCLPRPRWNGDWSD